MLARVFDGQSASVPADAERAVDFADWLLRGGFPEPRVNRQVDRQLWWASYVQTYLERDVRDLAQVADLGAFGRFLMLVGAHTGRVINLTELGRKSASVVQRSSAGCRCSRQADLPAATVLPELRQTAFARAPSCICSIQDWPPFSWVCTRRRRSCRAKSGSPGGDCGGWRMGKACRQTGSNRCSTTGS